MPVVKMPNGDLVNFPEKMTRDQIKQAIKGKFPDAFKEATGPELSTAEAFERGAGSFFGLGEVMRGAAAASPIKDPQIGGTQSEQTKEYSLADPMEALVGAGRMGLEYISPSVFGTSGTEAFKKQMETEKKVSQQHPMAEFAGKAAPLAAAGAYMAGPEAVVAGGTMLAEHFVTGQLPYFSAIKAFGPKVIEKVSGKDWVSFLRSIARAKTSEELKGAARKFAHDSGEGDAAGDRLSKDIIRSANDNEGLNPGLGIGGSADKYVSMKPSPGPRPAN